MYKALTEEERERRCTLLNTLIDNPELVMSADEGWSENTRQNVHKACVRMRELDALCDAFKEATGKSELVWDDWDEYEGLLGGLAEFFLNY